MTTEKVTSDVSEEPTGDQPSIEKKKRGIPKGTKLGPRKKKDVVEQSIAFDRILEEATSNNDFAKIQEYSAKLDAVKEAIKTKMDDQAIAAFTNRIKEYRPDDLGITVEAVQTLFKKIIDRGANVLV